VLRVLIAVALFFMKPDLFDSAVALLKIEQQLSAIFHCKELVTLFANNFFPTLYI
jgi:hypothetical protein